MRPGCQSIDWHDEVSLCKQPTVVYARIGCLHEHIEVSRLCQQCLDDLRSGEMTCTEGCYPDHECPVVLLDLMSLPEAVDHEKMEVSSQ